MFFHKIDQMPLLVRDVRQGQLIMLACCFKASKDDVIRGAHSRFDITDDDAGGGGVGHVR